MVEEENKISEGIAISIERMIRFCHLTQMTMEYIPRETLPLHLTRAGTLMTVTCSFLYSLFDKRSDSTNLLRIWTGFDHPFHQELSSIAKKLTPYEDNLYKLRSRYDFHGSVSRAHEAEGVMIFEDVEKSRKLFEIVHEVKQLAVKMVVWYMNASEELRPLIPDLQAELLGKA